MTDLSWTYAKDDSYILSRLSHYFGTYGIVVEVICAVTAYTVIFANILVRRKRSLKLSEMVLTIQHFCVSLLYVFGFIYWDFIDVWNDANVVTNFFSILTWIFIVGLNPFIYLSVNRRLRRAVLVLIRAKKNLPERTMLTVVPMCHTKTVIAVNTKWKKAVTESDEKV